MSPDDGVPPDTSADGADPIALGDPPATDNPWEYLAWVRQLSLDQRSPYFDPWVRLVGKRPRVEQDALLDQGKEPFRYRVETARLRLKELAIEMGPRTRYVPTVATDEFLAEMVYRPAATPPFGFLVYFFDKSEQEPPEIVEEVKVGDVIYKPLETALIEKRVIVVPTGVEEYGTHAELFAGIRSLIEKYLKVEPAFLTLASAWVMYTWLADRFSQACYLRLVGDLGTAKTHFEEIIGALCYRPIFAAGAVTAAPLFRILDRVPGTLVIDEADHSTRDDEWAQVLKILNTGIRKQHKVLRAERADEYETFDVIAYSCFGAKIVASRELLRDAAFESRCLLYATRPLSIADLEGRPVFLDRTFYQWAEQLQRQLLLWRCRTYRDVQVDPRQRIEGVTEARTTAMGLIVLSTVTDPEVRALIERQLVEYSEQLRASRVDDSFTGIVAQAAVSAWKRANRPTNCLLVKAITQDVQEMLPRASHQRIGAQLKALGFKTGKIGGDTYILNPPKALFERLARSYGLDLRQPLRLPEGG